MKVYHVRDLDGLTEGLVAAESLAEAAEAFGISVRTMRERGWTSVKGSAARRARDEPRRPLYRATVGAAGPWTSDRAQALTRGANAARRRGD